MNDYTEIDTCDCGSSDDFDGMLYLTVTASILGTFGLFLTYTHCILKPVKNRLSNTESSNSIYEV